MYIFECKIKILIIKLIFSIYFEMERILIQNIDILLIIFLLLSISFFPPT